MDAPFASIAGLQQTGDQCQLAYIVNADVILSRVSEAKIIFGASMMAVTMPA